jgi:hypothetical protein
MCIYMSLEKSSIFVAQMALAENMYCNNVNIF